MNELQNTLEKKAAELLANCEILTLSSITEEGYPRCYMMAKIRAEGFRTVWFSTGTNSRKTAHFLANPKAGVCYGNDEDSVTMIGEMEVVKDERTKRDLWQDWMREFFPQGPEDPEYAVLKFTAKEATIWIDKQFETYRYEG